VSTTSMPDFFDMEVGMYDAGCRLFTVTPLPASG
jgi:hypothetical protein